MTFTLIKITKYILGFLLLTLSEPEFGDRIDRGLVVHDSLQELSGLAASRKNPGVLWTHNDSGGKNRIYAIDSNGRHLGTFVIAGVRARDWEDIAVGPGPVKGQQYLYIGDIGDNRSRYDLKYIYRIPEPEINLDEAPIELILRDAETITCQYPDGRRDAETIMVDPLTKDIYIISKRESNVRVYRAPFPQSTSQVVTLEYTATLNLHNVVGGDISSTGDEIIIKTYGEIYYWSKSSNEDCSEVFGKKPVSVPYIPEPQGEAVCWQVDGLGYYTISEKVGGIQSHLYFYPRLNTSALGKSKPHSSTLKISP
ncbi:MAG: hypothetical protein ACE5IR_24360 [bacterium]